MSEIILSQHDLDLIRREGEAHFPDECCGFLFGISPPTSVGGQGGSEDRTREINEVIPIHNEQGTNRARRFLISPEEFRKAEAHARETNQELLGFYHTHPDHPAIPSEYDREHALPFYSYVILSVRNGRAAELRSWTLGVDRTAYTEENVTILVGTALSCRPDNVEIAE